MIKFRSFLLSEQVDLLRQVIETKALESEYAALQAQAESAKFENYTAVALGHLKSAGEYRTALRILEDLSKPETTLNKSARITNS